MATTTAPGGDIHLSPTQSGAFTPVTPPNGGNPGIYGKNEFSELFPAECELVHIRP
jgi:hypothetical protein